MVREKLNTYFSDRGFSRVDLHMPVADLYYLGSGVSASLIWIIGNEWAEGIDSESYKSYYKKIYDTFLEKGFQMVNILTLFISSDPKRFIEIGENTAFWIVDESYGRVIVYENQPEDFCSIRLSVEKMVSFTLADNIKAATENVKEAEKRTSAEELEFKKKRRKAERRRSLNELDRKSYVTFTLLIINVVIFLFTDLIGIFGADKWLYKGGVSYDNVFEYHEYYRLFTCMFLHFGADHIMGNMLGLYAAGEILEKLLGHVRFAILYLGGGVCAALGSCFYYHNQGELVNSAGASGAIYAIIGGLVAYFILHKDALRMLGSAQVTLFVVYMGYSLLLGFKEGGVDNAAHVTGLLAGALIYIILYLISGARGKSL